jgi:(p)ppGpp synthase/HD superfamily hydrolase
LEAHKVQTRIHELEKQEFTRYTSDRSKKIQNLLNQLRQKQEAELKALRQKIELGIEEKKKFKGLEM